MMNLCCSIFNIAIVCFNVIAYLVMTLVAAVLISFLKKHLDENAQNENTEGEQRSESIVNEKPKSFRYYFIVSLTGALLVPLISYKLENDPVRELLSYATDYFIIFSLLLVSAYGAPEILKVLQSLIIKLPFFQTGIPGTAAKENTKKISIAELSFIRNKNGAESNDKSSEKEPDDDFSDELLFVYTTLKSIGKGKVYLHKISASTGIDEKVVRNCCLLLSVNNLIKFDFKNNRETVQLTPLGVETLIVR